MHAQRVSRRVSLTRRNSAVDLASTRALAVGGRGVAPLAVDLCFDPWYQQVVLMAGGGLPFEPLAALQQIILRHGSHYHLHSFTPSPPSARASTFSLSIYLED